MRVIQWAGQAGGQAGRVSSEPDRDLGTRELNTSNNYVSTILKMSLGYHQKRLNGLAKVGGRSAGVVVVLLNLASAKEEEEA